MSEASVVEVVSKGASSSSRGRLTTRLKESNIVVSVRVEGSGPHSMGVKENADGSLTVIVRSHGHIERFTIAARNTELS